MALDRFDWRGQPGRREGIAEQLDDNRYESPAAQKRGDGLRGKRYSRVTGFGIITNHFFHMKVNPSACTRFTLSTELSSNGVSIDATH